MHLGVITADDLQREPSLELVERHGGVLLGLIGAALGNITLGEHRMALSALRERGVRLVDEQLIFDTVEAQRELVETAATATKWRAAGPRGAFRRCRRPRSAQATGKGMAPPRKTCPLICRC